MAVLFLALVFGQNSSVRIYVHAVLGAALLVQQAYAEPTFWAFRDTSSWEGGVSPRMTLNSDWSELILSWRAPHTQSAEFQVKLWDGPVGSKWLSMAKWTLESGRTSLTRQKDALASVDTDTLIAKKSGLDVQFRISAGQVSELYVVASKPLKDAVASPPALVGKILEPPRFAQMNYPNGNVICSPTSLAMVLGYWAEKLGRPSLAHEVPDVCKGVYDTAYKGTGNWAFNTAFAASQPGLRSYVSRLESLRDLEMWIDRDVPIVCSVSYDLLRGKDKKGASDGHLVVLVGFDNSGNPVFNDPGRNIVRMTYDRGAFDRAWASSGRTVYVVHPRTWAVPRRVDAPWLLDG